MKRDRKAQLKELKQQKAAGGQLSNRQQTRLDFLQRRAQDSKPAKQPQQPQPMPDWKPLNEQPGVFKPALDGMAQAAPGMPIRDMAERMGGQELRPDNMEMGGAPIPMPRGGMEQPAAQPAQAAQPQDGQTMPSGYQFDAAAGPGSSGHMYGIGNAGRSNQMPNPMAQGITGYIRGMPVPGAPRTQPLPGISAFHTNAPGIQNAGYRPPGLMGLGQKAAANG